MNSHLTEEQLSQWISGEQSREADDHIGQCPQCAADVGSTANTLLLFRDSGYQCAEYWQNRPQKSALRRPARWVLAAAAGVVLAAVTIHRSLVQDIPAKKKVFLQIPYVIPTAPYERTEVVRLDVPVAALIEAGLSLNVAAADSVPADVLVGQNGRPLAVAFPENEQ